MKILLTRNLTVDTDQVTCAAIKEEEPHTLCLNTKDGQCIRVTYLTIEEAMARKKDVTSYFPAPSKSQLFDKLLAAVRKSPFLMSSPNALSDAMLMERFVEEFTQGKYYKGDGSSFNEVIAKQHVPRWVRKHLENEFCSVESGGKDEVGNVVISFSYKGNLYARTFSSLRTDQWKWSDDGINWHSFKI